VSDQLVKRALAKPVVTAAGGLGLDQGRGAIVDHTPQKRAPAGPGVVIAAQAHHAVKQKFLLNVDTVCCAEAIRPD
jgi:hypothetical protein